MFTATWPQEVRQLASEFLTDPVVVNVGSSELAANPNIHQHVKVLEQHEKDDALFELMKELKKDVSGLEQVATKLRHHCCLDVPP